MEEYIDKGYDFAPRSFVGRTTRVEQVGDGPRSRTSYEFDVVDVDLAEDHPETFSTKSISNFALLRVLTTPPRFAQVFNGEPKVGDWYSLEVEARKAEPNRLTVWQAQLTDRGYTVQSRGHLTSAQYLFTDTDREPSPLSAAANPQNAPIRRLANQSYPMTSVIDLDFLEHILNTLGIPANVVVRDVGQASLASVIDQHGNDICHFDAGWPISFNYKTAPNAFALGQHASAVFLSHWDWDHMHGFYRFPSLSHVSWIAPVQTLGPGASRVAHILNNNGLLKSIGSGSAANSHFALGICNGPFENVNNSGLAMRVTTADSRTCLLVGDADYESSPLALPHAGLDGLAFTHHGALFNGSPPRAKVRKTAAVISCGEGNVYKHPKHAALAAHRKAGWASKRTSRTPGTPRGNRTLL